VPLPVAFDDFFIVGVFDERHEAFSGLHRARQATIPEPPTLALCCAGVGVALLTRRRTKDRAGHAPDRQ
jgi:hypothetical protein